MKRAIVTLGVFLCASPAYAHLNPAEYGSFAAGISHPLFGADHILAMIAVGLWAAMLDKHAIWALPSAFVGLMVIGFTLAVSGVHIGLVEPMILISVFALGFAIAFALNLPVAFAAGIVGMFGFYHGHAHGGELGSAWALTFGSGFILSTALLHVLGVIIALATAHIFANKKTISGLGWLITAGGFWAAIGG